MAVDTLNYGRGRYVESAMSLRVAIDTHPQWGGFASRGMVTPVPENPFAKRQPKFTDGETVEAVAAGANGSVTYQARVTSIMEGRAVFYAPINANDVMQIMGRRQSSHGAIHRPFSDGGPAGIRG